MRVLLKGFVALGIFGSFAPAVLGSHEDLDDLDDFDEGEDLMGGGMPGMPGMDGGMPGGMPGGMDDMDSMPEVPAKEPAAPVQVETLAFVAPSTPSGAFFWDTFQAQGSKWVKSANEKYTGDIAIDVRVPDTIVGDKALKLATPSAFHGYSSHLATPVKSVSAKPLFGSVEVQYEKTVNCGGAYVKLYDSRKLAVPGDLTKLEESTPYSIMFGPDKCGMSTNKVHLIIRYENPSTHEWQEAHLRSTVKLETTSPGASHQYGFALYPEDDTYEIYVDGDVKKAGKLAEDFEPAFQNAEEITDPDDTKPASWVDSDKMEDPEAQKPEDWDESAPEFVLDEDATMPDGWLLDAPLSVPNHEALKPEDWNDEEDGEWTPPMMKNPDCYVGCGEWKKPNKKNAAYKGPWQRPMVSNPDFKGPWKAGNIPNPQHYKIERPAAAVAPFDAIAVEVWTVETGAVIDNIILTSDKAEFKKFIEETHGFKHAVEVKNEDAAKAANDKSHNADTDAPRGLVANVTKGFSTHGRYLTVGLTTLLGLVAWRFARRATGKAADAKSAETKEAATKETEKVDAKETETATTKATETAKVAAKDSGAKDSKESKDIATESKAGKKTVEEASDAGSATTTGTARKRTAAVAAAKE